MSLTPVPRPDSCWIPSPGVVSGCCVLQRRYATCDYITITPQVKKTFLRLQASVQDSSQLLPADNRIYIEIKRRGCETPLVCYDAFQRTIDGYVGFYWDSLFTAACPGLYVGDVYVNCSYCFSVLFRIPKCEMLADACYNEYAAETCGDGECSMVDAAGEGVVGGLQCETSPDPSECGVAPPYFETFDPAIPEVPDNCNLSCAPPFQIVGDDIVGSI